MTSGQERGLYVSWSPIWKRIVSLLGIYQNELIAIIDIYYPTWSVLYLVMRPPLCSLEHIIDGFSLIQAIHSDRRPAFIPG